MAVKFKDISEGDTISAKYIIRNTGEYPLYLLSVIPECSCTSHSVEKKLLSKGDTTAIILNFDSKNKGGFNNIRTIIRANTKEQMHKLQFIVSVK